MKRRFVASVVLALFLCLLLVTPIKADILFVGDSYGEGYTDFGYTENWCDIAASYLNVDTYYRFTRNGSGFCAGTPFTKLVKERMSEISNPEKIDCVILGGGFNDWRFTFVDICARMAQFMSFVKEQFPNAEIYIAPIDYSWRLKPQTNIKKTVFLAYLECEKYGGIYLKPFEGLLNEREWFANDFVHPTLDGQKRIARMIFNFLSYKGIELSLRNQNLIINNPYSVLINFYTGNNKHILVEAVGMYQ